MPMSSPRRDDYVIEWRTMIGHGPQPVWTISRHGDVHHIYPDELLALRVVRELAHMEHCHAWLVAAGVDPVLLTANQRSASPVS